METELIRVVLLFFGETGWWIVPVALPHLQLPPVITIEQMGYLLLVAMLLSMAYLYCRLRTKMYRREVELQREILNAIPIPVFVRDRESRIVMANEAYARYYEVILDDVIGRHPREFLSENVVQQIEQVINELFETKQDVEEERVVSLPREQEEEQYQWLRLRHVKLSNQQEFAIGTVVDISDHKRLERELVDSADLLKQVLDAIPYPIFAKDTERRYVLVNESYLTQFSIPDDIVGKQADDFFPTEIAAQIYDNDTHGLEAGCFQGEFALRMDDGKVIHSIDHYATCCLPSGKTILVGSLVDITEQKLLAEQLRNTSDFLSTIIDAIPIPLFVRNRQHQYIVVNEAFAVLGHKHPAEFIGKTDRDLLPLEIAEPLIKAAEDVFITGNTNNGERVLPQMDSKPIYVVQQTKLGSMPNGEKVLIGGIFDITDRKEMELELRDATEFLKAVINSIPDLLSVQDEEYRYIQVNDAFCRRINKSHAELMGKTGYDVMPKESVNAIRHLDERLLFDGSLYEQERTLEIEGEKSHLLMKRAAHRLPSGQRIITTLAVDITARKHIEERLREAKKAADQANRAKSAFLSSMTHELRTPMNGVLGMTSLLLDTRLTEEQQILVDTIRTSGDALLGVINQILDFSKIEANKLELEETTFDLRTTLEETFDLLAPQATNKGLVLAYFLDERVPMQFMQDVGRLRQILTNLVSNGVKFTEQGEITITVSAKPLSNNLVNVDKCSAQRPTVQSYELQFVVRDTGMGIAPDRIDTLFQSFSQTDASITRRFGGTGLGLAISKRLAEAMGGTMWVESVVGEGTAFYFTIHAKSDSAEIILKNGQNHGHSERHHSNLQYNRHMTRLYGGIDLGRLSDKHILLLTQHEIMHRSVAQHLQSWSVLLSSISSLSADSLPTDTEESDICFLEKYDAIIVDCAIDGATRTRLLHHLQEEHADLPIVLLTLLGERIPEAEMLKRVAIVTKPLHSSQLHDALVTVVYGQLVERLRSVDQTMQSTSIEGDTSVRILLAEDNLVNQRVALGFLSKYNYRADIAGNGLEVLTALDRQSYDIIFMDVNMPEMDGLTTTEVIRSETKWSQPYIIAMTANAMYEDRKRCLEVGMNDYISKPIRINDLSAALKRAKLWRNQLQDSTVDNDIPLVHEDLLLELSIDNTMIDKPAADKISLEPHVQQEVVDPNALQEFIDLMGDGGEAMATELIRLYLEGTPLLIADFEQGLEKQYMDGIQHAAHTLRSGSAQIGAYHFAELAAEIDDLCHQNDLPVIVTKADKLLAEYYRVMTYFRAEYANRTGTVVQEPEIARL